MKRLFLTLLITIGCVFITFAQLRNVNNFKNNKIKIPFELSHNLILVKVVFNGVPLKMIVDTGSDKNLLFSIPQNDSLVLKNTEKIAIRGMGDGEMLEAYLTSNNQIKIYDYLDNNFELFLVPNQNINIVDKLGIPVNGILGSSFFKSGIVEINYQKKQLIIHNKKFKNNDKRIKKHQKLAVDFIENKPLITIPVAVNEQLKKYNLLFDTGLGDGLWLFENDTIKCNTIFFEDVLGVGFSGSIFGKKSRVKKVFIAGLALDEALVSYPDKIALEVFLTDSKRNGSLGGEITKRFNWFLDYENQTFYFKKNKLFDLPFEYNMSGIRVQHTGSEWVQVEKRVNDLSNKAKGNEITFGEASKKITFDYRLKPIFQIYAVRENSPADIAGLKVDDKIIKINNKDASQLDIQSISELFQSEPGKTIKILVERNGQQLFVTFQLQKIL